MGPTFPWRGVATAVAVAVVAFVAYELYVTFDHSTRGRALAEPPPAAEATPAPDAPARRQDGWLFDPPVPTVRWAPGRAGRHAAVVLLHGAGGPGFFTERAEYARYPEALAEAGFVVAMPRYSDSREAPADVVGAVVDWLGGEPDVDPTRLAVVGFSRGGFLGSCVAGTHARVRAFASFYGGVDAECRARIERMPPTLVLHGEADPLVPVELARILADFARDHGAEVELHTYPGQEHIFLAEALDDSASRLVAFFRRHLHVAPS